MPRWLAGTPCAACGPCLDAARCSRSSGRLGAATGLQTGVGSLAFGLEKLKSLDLITPSQPSQPARRPPDPAADEDRPAVRRRVAREAGSVRCFCPVPGCGLGDPSRASGWASHSAMRHHLNDHCSGTLQGAVPVDYLASHNLDACQVCGLLVDRRFKGSHPRCRPVSRPNARRAPSDGEDPSLPTFEEVMAAPIRLLAPLGPSALLGPPQPPTLSTLLPLGSPSSCSPRRSCAPRLVGTGHRRLRPPSGGANAG